ncbi:MAG: DEAD/DEAH box helicase, partial [Hyphomicrobiales bacterium]|nr:DEAD/DEAH box helicase [Hyphomicrobiales bacterium]
DLIRAEEADLKNAIIFCNRKVEVSELFRSLVKHDFDAGALHGDMDQRARMTMLSNFRDGKLKLLVASDVAARGLDIPDVSHVFNYDVPIHAEDYVHRIGRTGRAGRSGKAFTIATRNDTKYVDAIEKLIHKQIEWYDGDLSTLVASPDSEDERPQRGRARDRYAKKDRGERKPRDERRTSARGEKKPETVEVVETAALVSAEDVAERRSRKEAIRADNAERRQHKDSHDQRSGGRYDRPRRGRDEDDVNTVVGFGDDMPAFMKIAVKV